MKEFVPVYQYSEQESLRWNEQAKWRESFKENCSCARFIEEQIRSSFAAVPALSRNRFEAASMA